MGLNLTRVIKERGIVLKEKKVPSWKSGFLVLGVILLASLAGCSYLKEKNPKSMNQWVKQQENNNKDKAMMKRSRSEEKAIEKITKIYCKSYAKAEKEGNSDDLETIRRLVNKLGEAGYTAVDNENQIDMAAYEKLIRFCEMAEEKKSGRVTVVEVAREGNCVIRTMETREGKVYVIRSYYTYENGKLEQSSEDIYQAESWKYTEDGYLIFSGQLTFKESYEITKNEMTEYVAYRILPLDETCRELNRKYLLPIGYERNNLFLVDWSEDDFGELNFYDVFDVIHRKENMKNEEFVSGNAMGTSAVYLIAKERFEQIIMSKFNISSEILQSKTVYHSEEKVYEYRPRGFEEVEYPEYPYPEVVEYEENSDGTLTLRVNAVFPYRGLSKVYTHEVTVRDRKEEGIQYVSNHILKPINDPDIGWYTPHLTRTEWEELYGDNQ